MRVLNSKKKVGSIRMQKAGKKVFLIHFQPIELFPPALNMIDFFGNEDKIKLYVSTNKKLSQNSLKVYENKKVKIYRPSSFSKSKILQYFNYFLYYISTLFLLFKHKPDVVLYIETLSAWPALIYKKVFCKVKLMVHYHEYTEPALYKSGMILSRYMHNMERKMYNKFSWISHTNSVRMQMFKNDCNLNNLGAEVFNIIPNYPSKKWSKTESIVQKQKGIYKLVFVGSLGYDNMYLKEIAEWVSTHHDEITLDIFSYNIDEKAKMFLESGNFSNIKYRGGCNYLELPEILSKYDIGIDLYKPFALNHIHGVSNKIFEYLACGLDVWFSIAKPQTFEYIVDTSYPKVIPVNFEQMESFDYHSAIRRINLPFKESSYFYEKIYPKIVNHFLE